MITFEDVWKYTDTIYGSFTKAEAQAMYDTLLTIPPSSVVVEIGSYCGRSSSLIGMMAMQEEKGFEFYCVDNFITPWEGKDVHAIFETNMRGIKHELMKMNSKRASHLFDDGEIDFLFVDGDHLYEGVMADIKRWLPKVKVGGAVLFHDYNSSWEGVQNAVDQFVYKDGDNLTLHSNKPMHLVEGKTFDSLLVTHRHD